MRLYLIFCILLANVLYSQDSIQENYSILNQSRWFDNFFVENFDKMEYWDNDDANNYTTSSLYLENNHKNIYLGQEPKSNTTIGVNTHGKWKNPNNNITFTGNIDISKSYQIDKAWNNSPFEVNENGIMSDPHYFLVQRSGNWKNTKYNLKGAISIPVLNRFKVSASAKYNLEEKYRVNLDPRTEVSINALEGKLSLYYKIKNHNLGIAYQNGYTDYNTDHTRIIKEQDTPYYYEKYLKWMWGYGQFFNISRDNSRREGNVSGYSAKYSYTNKKSFAALNFNKKSIETDNFDSESKSNPDEVEDHQFGVSKNSMYHLNLFAHHQFNDKNRLYLIFEGTQQEFNNIINTLNGITYKSEEDKYYLQLSNAFEEKNRFTEYGVKFNYEKYNQQDLLSEIYTKGNNVLLGIFAQKELEIKHLNLVPYLEFNYHFKNNNLQIINEPDFSNVSEVDFINLTKKAFFADVIYHDHNLLNQDVLNFHFQPEFIFKTQKKYNFVLTLGLHYQYFLKDQKANRYFNASLSIKY